MYHEKEERGNVATSHPILTLTMSTEKFPLEVILTFPTQDLADRALAFLPNFIALIEDAHIERSLHDFNLRYKTSLFCSSDISDLRLKLGVNYISFTVLHNLYL